VEQQPAITSVSPSTGPLNSRGTVVPVTIGGAGFGATQSGFPTRSEMMGPIRTQVNCYRL
jgi:hypothetical protein